MHELFRMVDIALPKVVVIEEVRQLLSGQSGYAMSTLMREFDARGFQVAYRILNGLSFGGVQNRDRIFIIAVKRGLAPPENAFALLREYQQPQRPLTSILDEPGEVRKCTYEIPPHISVKPCEQKRKSKSLQCAALINNETGKGNAQGSRVYNPDSALVTLTTGTVPLISSDHGKTIRYLTLRECKRAFGLPDSFFVVGDTSDAEKMKSMGVCVDQHVLIPLMTCVKQLYFREVV